MGQKISDGKAFNAVAPDGEVIDDYDLYRIDGWNGAEIGAKTSTQTDRTLAFEMDTNAIYSVKVPDALDPGVGDLLYWDEPSLCQAGADDLKDTADSAGDRPCLLVLAEKNAAGYVQGRILN